MSFVSRSLHAPLKQIFSEQGIPQSVRTDNGPQFNSKEFSELSSVYGFKHVTSSPHYPRSNGFIESQVKIVKRTLEKLAKDNGDPHLALLYLRSTPVDRLLSQAQLLQHRSFMDTLPKIPAKGDDNVLARLKDRQHVQKSLYDQHAKAMEPLRPGQPVSVLDPTSHTWKPATVCTVCDEPRSYAVVTKSVEIVRISRRDNLNGNPVRNRRLQQLLPPSLPRKLSPAPRQILHPVRPMPRHLNRRPAREELSKLHRN